MIIALSQYRIHKSQPATKGKPSGKRECRLLLMSLLLYFYCEHLQSSVTIYSVLQVVLFAELLSQINEISWILQSVKKLPSPDEPFYTRPINTRLSMSMKPTTLTVKPKADLNDKRSQNLKPLKHDKNVYLPYLVHQ